MTRYLLLLLLLLPVRAGAVGAGCQNTSGPVTLEKLQTNATGPQFVGCINRSFEILSSSMVVSNSTSPFRFYQIYVSTIGGNPSSNGINLSSYVYVVNGASLTLQGAAGYIRTSSSVTASAFFGNGAGVTGVTLSPPITFASSVTVNGSVVISTAMGITAQNGLTITATPSASSNAQHYGAYVDYLTGYAGNSPVVGIYGAATKAAGSSYAAGIIGRTQTNTAGLNGVGIVGDASSQNAGDSSSQNIGVWGRGGNNAAASPGRNIGVLGSAMHRGSVANAGGYFALSNEADTSVSDAFSWTVTAGTAAVVADIRTNSPADIFHGIAAGVVVATISATGKFSGDGSGLTGIASIADGIVTTDKIGSGAVTTGKLATDAVYTGAIRGGAVTSGKIGTDAVVASNILGGSITTGKLASDAVATASILNLAVTTGKLSADLQAQITAAAAETNTYTSSKTFTNALAVQTSTFTITSPQGQVSYPGQWGFHLSTLSNATFPSGSAIRMFWSGTRNEIGSNVHGAWVVTSSDTVHTKDNGYYDFEACVLLPAMTNTVRIGIYTNSGKTLSYDNVSFSGTFQTKACSRVHNAYLAANEYVYVWLQHAEGVDKTLAANAFYDSIFSGRKVR